MTLQPGHKTTVTFTLDKSDFGFYGNRGRFVVEPGEIDVFGRDSSTASMTASFTVRQRMKHEGGRRRAGRPWCARPAHQSSLTADVRPTHVSASGPALTRA